MVSGTGMIIRLVKSFVLLIWDTKLYGDHDGETSGCSCPLTGGLTSSAWCKHYGSDMSILHVFL